MLYTVTLMPYKLSFYDTSTDYTFDIIENIVQSLFGLDIILSFFSAYYNEHDVLITDFKLIVINYFKTWFVFDVLAV